MPDFKVNRYIPDISTLINYFHLNFRWVNCLNLRRPLKKLSKVFVWGSSQEHFSENFPQITTVIIINIIITVVIVIYIFKIEDEK